MHSRLKRNSTVLLSDIFCKILEHALSSLLMFAVFYFKYFVQKTALIKTLKD
jgi:hypothetical protein